MTDKVVGGAFPSARKPEALSHSLPSFPQAEGPTTLCQFCDRRSMIEAECLARGIERPQWKVCAPCRERLDALDGRWV